MNLPPSGDIAKRFDAHNAMFKVTAQDSPNMTVKISPGSEWINGTFIEYVGGSSPTLTATSIPGAKWTLISLNEFSKIVVTDGTPAASSPNPPIVPKNQIPLALIYIKNVTTRITNDMIFDVRPFFSLHGPFHDHNELNARNMPDAHPINAITDLRLELDSRPTNHQVNTLLNMKADIDGTIAQEFTLNKDATGAPSSDVFIYVERGDSQNVGIRWNETLKKWQYTNDGVEWWQISNAGTFENATATAKGVVKLSTNAINIHNPIAVGDNDNRIFSIQEKTDTLTHISAVAPHSGHALVNHDHNSSYYLKSEIDSVLVTKANNVHTHTKANITDFNHDHDSSYYLKSEVNNALATKAEISHTHTKANITDFNHDHNTLYYSKTEVYTKLETDNAIQNIVGAAPGALNTLKELADALNNDPNFSTTIVNSLATKADKTDTYLKSEVDNALSTKANNIHTHTKAEITDFNHNHNLEYYLKSEVDNFLSNKSNIVHNHDTLYYGKTEVDNALATKAEISHTHTKANITDFNHDHTKAEITDFNHDHNLEYYLKSEVDNFLSNKADITHTHSIYIEKNGISGTFTTVDGKTITVVDGQIVNII